MIKILHDNDNIIAIEKPAGLSSIPERDLTRETVLSTLETQFGQKLFVVHRLDKEVSGVMLFAKIAAAHKLLNRQFFKRTINKTYTALVLGFVKEDKGSIDKAIRRFGSGRMGVDDKSGKPCTTNFEVINRREQTTLIRAFPVTGRRHQIRVHLYHLGHPVAGDMLYGDRNLQKTFPRLMLHATKIRFQDSQKNEITVTSDLPKEFV